MAATTILSYPLPMLILLLRRHGRTLTGLWALNLLGSLAHALYPFATGLAINGVLDGDYRAIAWLVGCHALMLVSEVSFMRIDTRVFARIYATFASELVVAAHLRGCLLSGRLHVPRCRASMLRGDDA